MYNIDGSRTISSTLTQLVTMANGKQQHSITSEFPYLDPEATRNVVVGGLESCAKYNVTVTYHYISYFDQVKRTKTISVNTRYKSLQHPSVWVLLISRPPYICVGLRMKLGITDIFDVVKWQ